MGNGNLEIPEDTLRTFCEQHGILRLAVFGSVLRTDFTPTSDLDVLVEFAPGRIAGLFRLAEIEHELSLLAGRKVDLNTPGSLSRHFRDKVIAEAKTLYVAA